MADRSYPENLEQAILLAGPPVLESLIRDAGGLSAAARIGGTTRATLGRWLRSNPVAGSFGAGSRGWSSYQSVWCGYPPPLPGLDRVTEAILEADTSFITALSARLDDPVRELALNGHFGLDMLFTPDQIRFGLAESQVPPSTARRWRSQLSYPVQLRVLDRLSLNLRERRWIHLVLELRPAEIVERTPPEALGVLLQHLCVRGVLDASGRTG